MKALILAAGFGTRLLPYSKIIPKPLFTLLSRPLLDHAIKSLVTAGCEQIIINTHHLHEQINAFVKQKQYPVDIHTIFEPVILDTGGAIANARPFLKNHPFFVINADVISTIDLKKLYETHQKSNCMATLVLHDYPQFNKVGIDNKGYVQSFDTKKDGLAFTGIQVLDPEIYDHFPRKNVFSSIPVYQNLCHQNQVKAMVEKNIFWSDIGTPAAYSRTSMVTLAAAVFGTALKRTNEIHIHPLAGDGSDRQWYRAEYKDRSKIICDHGICMANSDEEKQVNAFIHIGSHLLSKRIPLPRILEYDKISGMVILEDLGDVHLETEIRQKNNNNFTLKRYRNVIDHLIDFSSRGLQEFNAAWTCQTETYSKELIIEKECRYFIEAFIQNYKKLDADFDDFSEEFDHIADQALAHGQIGLMHRDFQSRNIMIRNDQIYFIDFQSARIGPLEYDLASLIIDPYVNLEDPIKKDLLAYTMEKLNLTPDQRCRFMTCYHYCCLTRNMQFLGAFSFLTQIKKKKKFEHYIPDAVNSLKKTLSVLKTDKKLHKLTKLVHTL